MTGVPGVRTPARGPRALHCLTFGYEPIPESVSLRGGDPARFLLEPVTGAAVVYDEGWVLIDTGFNVATVRDPRRRAAHYNFENYTAIVPPGDPLVDQMALLGLTWDRLLFAAVSHLHLDHSGGIHHLVDGPPVVIQDREIAFGLEEAGLEHAYFRDDYDLADVRYHRLDGSADLAPGLRAVATFGHTPGHTSFQVELPVTGTIVLACDAADLKENIEGPVACGTTTHPHLEPAAEESARALHEMDAREGWEVWPGHDPQFWSTRRHPPHAYT